jgi:hypothetical protein
MNRNRLNPCVYALIAAFCLATTARAQTVEVLDNGLLRVSFNRTTGLFEVQSAIGGSLHLFDAGPRLEVNGQEVSSTKATRIEVQRSPFADTLGSGEKLIVTYAFTGDIPSYRYELSLYKEKPWLTATAYLPRGDYALGDVALIRGKVHSPGAYKTRVYVNSGTAGNQSGVWEMGIQRWDSAALSVLYEPNVQDALELGFYSFSRASTSVVSQYLSKDEIAVEALAHYYGHRPQKGDLRTESVLLEVGRDPLGMLEEWADLVVKVTEPRFLHDTGTGALNPWYIYGDRITEDDVLNQLRLLEKSPLRSYGISVIGLGEWQIQRPQAGDTADRYGFGENQEDKSLFPHGVKWLADQVDSMGFQGSFGANYAYAAPESSIAKIHVPWVIWKDLSRLEFGYPIDFTDPAAQDWIRKIAHRAVEFKAKAWWDDFDGGPKQGPLHDPEKIMQFEDIREGLKVIRQEVGPDVFMHHFCCGPYFAYIGLADQVRVGRDSAALGDFEGFKEMARQLAANYMLHQRFWINDPDSLYVGGQDFVHNPGATSIGADPATLDEARMRLQYQLSTGGFVTLGEDMGDSDTARTRLLTLVLPPYGQAARPLDLFVHTTPEMYDLKVKTSWDEWHVLMVQNWGDDDKNYEVRFDKLGLDEKQSYLIYRFWDQTFLGEFRDCASLRVKARQGETFAIRNMPEHPWVLSTDMHLTQGGVELSDVKYDAGTKQLTGFAKRHPGAEGHVVIYAPYGYHVHEASGDYRQVTRSSGAEIIDLDLKFSKETAPWSMTFAK